MPFPFANSLEGRNATHAAAVSTANGRRQRCRAKDEIGQGLGKFQGCSCRPPAAKVGRVNGFICPRAVLCSPDPGLLSRYGVAT
jgi:hypothetical protein